MADKSEGSNDALGRIAPKRKSFDKPATPSVPVRPSLNEGISIPRTSPKPRSMAPRPVTRPTSRPRYSTFPPAAKVTEEIPKPKEPPKPLEPEEHIVPPTQEVEENDQDEELNEIIKDVKSGKPKRYRKVIYILVSLLIVLLLIGVIYYFFLREKPSVYSDLTTENYNQNSISFSFKYPSILTQTQALSIKNPDILVAYEGTIGPDNTLVDLSTLSDSQAISNLKLTPSDILNQIKNGSGSYINYLNKGYPDNYKSLFGTCSNNMVNTANQVMVVCSSNTDGYVDTRLVGADNNYQYILQLYMSTPVWNNNPSVWYEVEKSFNW